MQFDDPQLFIGDGTHERTVVLGDGSERKFRFRELPNTDLLRITFEMSSSDVEERAAARAHLVALSLCDEEGKPVLPFEHAIRLKPKVLRSFFDAALEVNSFGDDEKKG